MNKEKEVEAYLKGVLPEEQKLKYEIAQELGILEPVSKRNRQDRRFACK